MRLSICEAVYCEAAFGGSIYYLLWNCGCLFYGSSACACVYDKNGQKLTKCVTHKIFLTLFRRRC